MKTAICESCNVGTIVFDDWADRLEKTWCGYCDNCDSFQYIKDDAKGDVKGDNDESVVSDFREKIEQIIKIQRELNRHIWDVFYKYVREFRDCVPDHDSWNPVSDGCIWFSSCEEDMSIGIPIEFFIDYETAISKEIVRRNEEKLKREKLEQEKTRQY